MDPRLLGFEYFDLDFVFIPRTILIYISFGYSICHGHRSYHVLDMNYRLSTSLKPNFSNGNDSRYENRKSFWGQSCKVSEFHSPLLFTLQYTVIDFIYPSDSQSQTPS